MQVTRNTIQRDIVLQTVRAMDNHPTADEIYQQVVLQNPHISRATVYRNLNLLATRGEIQQLQMLDGPDRFDHTMTAHYHIQCRKCGRIFDVDMPHVGDLQKKIRDDRGFVFEKYDILFSGLCPNCK